MRYIRWLVALCCVLGIMVCFTLFPGHVVVCWLGYEVELPVSLLILALVFLMVLTALCLHLWNTVVVMPERMRAFLARKRIQKAEATLLEGLSALAAQQLDEARSCVAFSQKLLPHHPLTAYVAAQSASLAKDVEQAGVAFAEMTQYPSIAFLGYRGLIIQAQANKDWLRVQQLLKTVFEERPDSPWVIQMILQNSLYLAENNILLPDGIDLLKSVYRFVPKREANRHQVFISWFKAFATSSPQERFTLLEQAYKACKDIVCVVIAFADQLVDLEYRKQASKVLGKSIQNGVVHRTMYDVWLKSQPKPDPIAFYVLVESVCNVERVRCVVEERWILMQGAIAARMWGQAHSHAQDLLADGDDRDVCLAMAGMYTRMNDEVRALQWQRRALNATWAYAWECSHCRSMPSQWSPICCTCRSVDTLRWARHSFKHIGQTIPYVAPATGDSKRDASLLTHSVHSDTVDETTISS